jgi:hypothetical protein
MATVMLIKVPFNAGPEYAGLPLKTLTSGNLTLKDGTEIPVDNDIFTTVKAEDFVVVDGKEYKVRRSSAIGAGLGKIILEEQE